MTKLINQRPYPVPVGYSMLECLGTIEVNEIFPEVQAAIDAGHLAIVPSESSPGGDSDVSSATGEEATPLETADASPVAETPSRPPAKPKTTGRKPTIKED